MDILSLKIGDEEIAVCKGTTIEPKQVMLMEYYYCRKNRWYFRNRIAKLIVEAEGDVKLVRGQNYKIEITSNL